MWMAIRFVELQLHVTAVPNDDYTDWIVINHNWITLWLWFCPMCDVWIMKHTEGTECSSNSCHQRNNIYANITTKHWHTCILKEKPRDANVLCIEYNRMQSRTTASKRPQPSWRRPLTLCPMTPPWWLRTLAGRSCQAYTSIVCCWSN